MAGIAVATPDALVAAVALDIGAIVVTNNVKHYLLPGVDVLRSGEQRDGPQERGGDDGAGAEAGADRR